jgi:hypothetical protein
MFNNNYLVFFLVIISFVVYTSISENFKSCSRKVPYSCLKCKSPAYYKDNKCYPSGRNDGKDDSSFCISGYIYQYYTC